MSRNSSGTYTQPGGTTAVSGATIDPTSFNTLITDLGSELTNSLDRGGRGALTAAMNAGGFKLTNAADPTVSTDVATKNYVDTSAVPSTRLVSAGTGLSGGGSLAADRTISLANTAVSAGSYTRATITVDAQGRLTAAAAGASELPSQASNSGKFLTTDGTNPSWGTVAGYTQPTTAGGIGTYALLMDGAGALAVGGTTAGSNLSYVGYNSAGGSASSGTPSGTWQAMGFVFGANYGTLFLRIS